VRGPFPGASYDHRVAGRDWWEWHRAYDDPSSSLARRLAIVQRHLETALDRCPAGPIQVVSVCAGQGRDLFGVLAGHRRRVDVRATLVERDERNAEIARQSAAALGLPAVRVVSADAGMTDVYGGSVPADVLLACGVFGNITDDDISRTVDALPALCGPDATVIWTRHRKPPDLTPSIRGRFARAGFAEMSFDGPEDDVISVGVHRLIGPPRPLEPGIRLFAFVGDDDLGRPDRQ
jgi:hypothetical protein